MTVLALVALSLALVLLLRVWRRQSRRLERLHGAIKAGRPYLEDEGASATITGWRTLVEDVNTLITENSSLRQQRSDQLAQLEATLGNLREAVLIVDESNVIHLANRALRDIFPGARNLVNLRLELIIRSAPFQAFVAAIRSGDPLPRQEFEVAGDGAHGPTVIEVSGAPIASPDGKEQWALFVIHDMTSQRRLERMRRDFVANASHELRTPLSIIKGYIETLVDGHAEMPAGDRERFLRTIQRHSERLNAIIQDLLILSRLESGTPGLLFETVDLGALLESIGEDYRRRPGAEERALVVAAGADLGTMRADPEKLRQVLGNLLDNAFKYTAPGARIELVGRALESGGVELAVRDNGPGIPAADLPHIFERFYRADKGRSRETGGTGLGLSIVKHIVQLHGGRVWAESAPGQGTAILLRLPREMAGAAAEPRPV
ncbi:MAG TPA: ATP-binding protein [Opitutaceae bacterium]|nr:ATP-binding protein [Opitutaceae bacterium]